MNTKNVVGSGIKSGGEGDEKSAKKVEISRKRSRMIFVISQMPPLVHWDREGEFDIGKSEVCRWLMGQPDFMNWAVQKARDLGAIEYREGKWVGVNYGAGPAAVSMATQNSAPETQNSGNPGTAG